MLNRNRWVYSIIISMLFFISFGCISYSFFLDMDADASGKGTIYHSVTFPDFGETEKSPMDSYIERLNAEGWENLEFSSPGEGLLQLTAEYKVDPEADRGFPESLKGYEITVEEAENGYKYFTMIGNYDYTNIQKSWQKIINADSGSVDLGKIFGGEFTAMDKEDIDALIQKYGEPKVEFKFKLPGNTPVETKGTWSNTNDYMNGKTDIIEFVWTPDKRPTGNLMVSRRWEPKIEVTEEQINQNLNELFIRYQQEIPLGWNINIVEIPTGGWFNNIIFAHFNNEAYTCGSYQNYVMGFLDQIRTSPDPEINSLLNGLDYGPIQTNGGGHVAVVVYPSGSDWTETGTVFDPWPTQRPQIYPVDLWFLILGPYAYGGYYPEVSYGSEFEYPHLSGKPSSYPAQADLDRHLAEPVRQILVINSPVTVQVQLEDGSLIGVNPGGTAINQTPWNVSFYALPKENGEHAWAFFLPDKTANVSIYGQSDGIVHTALVSEDGITSFGPQEITQGETASFSIQPDANLSPMTFADGHTANPFEVQREDFLQVMGMEEIVEEEVESPPSTNLQPNTNPFELEVENEDSAQPRAVLAYAILGLCCCSIIIAVIVVVVVFYLKRK